MTRPAFPLQRHALLSALIALSLAVPPSHSLLAANHPNSRVASTPVLDLTANVDWDYDATPPTQAGGGVTLTKEVLSGQILREVARSVFLMTEGRHRIGTVYLYKNGRFGKNVDIQIINKSDRSYASVAKWQQSEGSSFNFLAMDNRPENLRNYSRVIAHELGHYVYGFADEYREDGKALSSTDLGSPSGVDFTRNSIMNNHESFTRLSLAADYAGSAAENNTAQARVYATDRVNLRGGSHWEMLTRDPANDPAEAKAFHNGDRVWFDAFKGFTAPTKVSELTRYFGVYCDPSGALSACGVGDTSRDQVVPLSDRITDLTTYNAQLFAKSGGSVGVDAADGAAGSAFESFKVVFVDSPATDGKSLQLRQSAASKRLAVTARAVATSAAVPRHAIVIDRTLSSAAFEEARQAAVALLQLADTGSQWAVVASPGVGTGPVAPLQAIDSGRASLVALVQGLTRVEGRFDAATAVAQAQAELAKGRQDADSATLDLLTAQGRTVPKSVGSDARQNRIAVNAVGLRLPAGSTVASDSGQISLDALASATGGAAFVARDAEHAIKSILRAERKASGEVFSLLATTGWDSLNAGTQSTPLTVTRHDTVISAHWNFDPADKARLSFRLVTPAGTFSTLSAASNLDDGYALIEVDNSGGAHVGSARAETLASTAVANAVGLDVQTETLVEMSADFEGGTLNDNREPVIRVQFTGQAPVAKARVTATVWRSSDGVAVLSDLVLSDDGQGVDSRADDGHYAISLKGRLPAGDYTVSVRAETTADSVFQPNQVFAIGSVVPVRPVGAGLLRVDEIDVTLEEGASGVIATGSGSGSGSGSSSGGGGGGCTVVDGQRDLGLGLLLIGALAGLGLRRRRLSDLRARG